ncbi:hypothetical protein LTR86_008854 [Recurvomyces mirabilis]|nr:hypothetical protein LTR86_008854 [Recurvomyces mirabilis]
MDHSNQQPQQRDMVFCHQCENEWYRDEHGLTCPECQSDFTEIIETNHDPREDNNRIPAEPPGTVVPQRQQHGEFYGAPDPDEVDLDNIEWRQTGPGTYRGSINRTITIDPRQLGQQQQGQGGLLGGIMGALGNVLGGVVTQGQQNQNQPGQYPGQQPGQPQQYRQLFQQQPQPGQPFDQRPQSADGSQGNNRSASVPPGPQGGASVRHWHGPNFHMTMMTSSNGNMGAGNLFPRNANAPQPFQQQPDQMEQMLAQMFMNVGGPAGMRMAGPGQAAGPGMFPGAGQPGVGGMGGMGMLGNLMQMLGMPGHAGQMGDFVLDQATMDRVMTQFMEQHQSGNAPGPAPEAAINSLPTRMIVEKDFSENGKAECTICMDEVALGATVTELPCHHWFHFECIKAWLSEHDTCPHCRQGIMPKDEAATNQARQPNQAPRHDTHAPEYHGPAEMPGSFPPQFTRQGSGSQQNPYAVPESSPMHRRSSSTPGRPGSSRQGSAGDSGRLFQGMRNAFGSGGGSGGNNGNAGGPSGYS